MALLGKKKNVSGMHPAKSTLDPLIKAATSGPNRIEPLITPKRVRDEFLFGLPLASIVTGEKMTDATLQSIINRKIDFIETVIRVPFFPVERTIRIDFDRTKYIQGFNQLDLGYAACIAVNEVCIRAANSASSPYNENPPQGGATGTLLYDLPLDWIDMGTADKGLLHLVPLQASIGSTMLGSGPITGAYAPLFAVFTSQFGWIPSFWYIRATFGITQTGQGVPAIANELIGNLVAQEILSMLGPQFGLFISKSIGLDGISQSTASAGPSIFVVRYNELEAKIQFALNLFENRFGRKFFMSHI
jgi:hypothetical protein